MHCADKRPMRGEWHEQREAPRRRRAPGVGESQAATATGGGGIVGFVGGFPALSGGNAWGHAGDVRTLGPKARTREGCDPVLDPCPAFRMCSVFSSFRKADCEPTPCKFVVPQASTLVLRDGVVPAASLAVSAMPPKATELLRRHKTTQCANFRRR